MNNNDIKTTQILNGESDYKVIEVNLSDTSQNLYAVVTPIKKM